MMLFGKGPYLECSSQGDKRFSAFYAKVEAEGGKTIEAVYQAAKILEDGSTGNTIEAARGKTAKNAEECRAAYSILWRQYFVENPHLLFVIAQHPGFSDQYGKPGHACQAEEIWKIRNEFFDRLNIPRLLGLAASSD